VQTGHHCVDAPKLSAMLVHSGEELQLFQNLGSGATGCRLDVGRLLDAGTRVAGAIEAGADVVIVNRFGRQECEGKGLSYLVERALSGLDQIRRRHERQAALRPLGAECMVAGRLGAKQACGRARSPDHLRGFQIGSGRNAITASPACARTACRRI
jgi:hypothetical protein